MLLSKIISKALASGTSRASKVRAKVKASMEATPSPSSPCKVSYGSDALARGWNMYCDTLNPQ